MDPNSPQNNQENHDKLRYEALLASIGEGLIITNNLGEITSMNKAAESMLGWEANEAIGKHLQDVVHMEYHNGQHAEDVSSSLNKLTISQPLYFIRKDGTKFPVSIKVTSYVENDKILGTINLFHDVTTEHNIDQMKTEFISLTSHQLKTPIAAIRWNSELLLSGDLGQLTEKQVEVANTIHTSIRHMNDLVNALLNISRIESGRLQVNPMETDLTIMVNEILEEVKTRPDGKKRNFAFQENSIPKINIDQTLVRQIYLNLITNAVKYSPEGANISISIYTKDNDLVSQVTDTGYGIPKNEQSRIFERFYRGESASMREISGNGLGLYLTKNLVELSGGKIWYDSAEGKGTTFYFTLPLSGTSAREGVVSLDS